MAIERGVVSKIEPGDDNLAWVTTKRSGSCEHCMSKDFCQEKGDKKEMEVQANNDLGAEVGDQVVIMLESSALLKAAFLMYVFPIIAMLLGAILGDRMAPQWGFDPTLTPVVAGFLFFALAILVVRFRSNKMAKKNSLQPQITRIAKKAPTQRMPSRRPRAIDRRGFIDLRISKNCIVPPAPENGRPQVFSPSFWFISYIP